MSASSLNPDDALIETDQGAVDAIFTDCEVNAFAPSRTKSKSENHCGT